MDRICSSLESRVMSAGQAAQLIKSGMTLGCSGFSRVGYPKLLPRALAQSGHAKELTVVTGASVGEEMDGEMTRAGLIARRYPYQNDKSMRASVNAGELAYNDMHLSHLPLYLQRGGLHLDFAVVECAAVTDEGIIPPASLGILDTVIQCADRVILEVNDTIPLGIRGMHDLVPGINPMPHLDEPAQRIGSDIVPCPTDKIAAVIPSSDPGSFFRFGTPDEASAAISGYIVDFLKKEVEEGRLPKELPPIQSGTGSVANSVLQGLASGGFGSLKMYSEVFQDAALELMDRGIITQASATALTFSKEMTAHFYDNIAAYRDKIAIRPQILSNNPAVIRALGVISLNTALECDIYGNVNSSHQFGTKLMNGIGGSGDFARNAGLTIFSTVSTAKNGAISCVVPMASHIDHTEHDVQVLVTEQGLADLRWKSPRERAELIIDRCAHPDYRAELREYFEAACRLGGQTPHDLGRAFAMHQRYLTTGSMK